MIRRARAWLLVATLAVLMALLAPHAAAVAQEDAQAPEAVQVEAVKTVDQPDVEPKDDPTEEPLTEAVADVAPPAEAAVEGPLTEATADEAPLTEAATPSIQYRTHVQNDGWQNWVRDGAMAGTTGRLLRLEGIFIDLANKPCSGGVEYRTHVQNIGWQSWRRDGAMAGTEGQSLRLEAIQIRLYGELADRYDVWYHVHAQDFGWLDWAHDGDRAGTATYSKRLEGIEVRLLPKGTAAPGATTRPYVTRLVQYRTHVQNIGWQDWSYDGAVGGTSGRSLRLEGLQISLSDAPYDGGVEYRTHVQNIGWQSWRRDGAMAGTEGQSLRLEAMQVRLYGELANHYDVWYRVHAQDIGWMGWATNGQQAGTEGQSKRLEATQLLLVPKGSSAPSTTLGGIQQSTAQAFSSTSVATPNTGSKKTSPGPNSAGALKVKGSQLVDKDGKAIQLTGISTHGLAWFPAYVNDACFKQLRNEWNANVVRLAMYTEEYGGYCSGGNQADLTSLVKKGVDLATSNDLYVIVDWHILSDGNPNTHVNEAKAFFADISSTYKNNVNVIYEICNEPNGGTSWSDIKTYANKVIPVIRNNDPDAIVIVGTPTWSQEVDKAAASKLSYDNVLYALHFYAATHKDDLRNRMSSAVNGGLPVFVSEFGICDASGNGSIDEASANSWMATMRSLGVSWCMWSLCNKAESASAIKSGCTATSAFKAGDLTTSGTWLLKALNGTLPAGTVSSTQPTPTSSTSGETSTATPTNFTSDGLSCSATLTNSWTEGNGKSVYQYELSITNTGVARSSWNVTVPFNQNITYVNGWNGTYKANGSKLTIRNANYNGSIASGATVSGIGFQVSAESGLSVK